MSPFDRPCVRVKLEGLELDAVLANKGIGRSFLDNLLIIRAES